MMRYVLRRVLIVLPLLSCTAILDAQSPATWQVAPAWSPDGSRLVTVSKQGGHVDLWVSQADGGAASAWTDDAASESEPEWSPNGQCIAYVTTRETRGVDVKCADAPPRRLIADASMPRWSPDGRHILCTARRNGHTTLLAQQIDGSTQAADLLPWLSEGMQYVWATDWRPDGEHISIVGLSRGRRLGLWVVSLNETGPLGNPRLDLGAVLKDIGTGSLYGPRLSPAGDTFYFGTSTKGQGQVWRIRLDPQTQAQRGRPEKLAQAAAESVAFAVSPNGARLAVAWESSATRIWMFPFNPEAGDIDVSKGQPVGPERAVSVFPDFTPAGDRLVYATWTPESDRQALHIRQADGTDRQLVADHDVRFAPRWSPDGTALSYRWQTAAGDRYAVRTMDVQTAAEHEVTSQFPTTTYTPFAWTPDRQALLASFLYPGVDGGTAYVIVRMPLGPGSDRKAKMVAGNDKFQLWQSRVSPDGRWMAFIAQPLDGAWSTLMVMPLEGGQWKAITDQQDWDDKPRWSPDGRTIYFLSRRSGEFELWSVAFNPETGTATNAPRQLTHLSDGQRHIYRGTGWLELAISSTQMAVPIEELESRFAIVPITTTAESKKP